MNQKSNPNALPVDYELHWYKLENVLGQGAFGITYLAHDINLERQVAIKEYMPGQLSTRNSDHTIQPVSPEQQEDFEWGLKRFISEARTLTKFEHPNLVRVFNVFEMNKTAYMVMNYEIGKGLQEILKSRKTLREDELIRILIPLMSGLEIMHKKGFIHRDIKPGNIFIRQDGSPVLLDFGSARQTRNPRGAEGQMEPQTVTNFVSPGYAPIEQYAGKSDRQGPWTDIYGLGATLYRAITGDMPVASVDRSETIVHDGKDAYLPASRLAGGRYSEQFLAAVDHALAFKTSDRPQTIAEWQKEFGITEDDMETVPRPEVQTETKDEISTVRLDQSPEVTINLSERTDEKTEKIGMDAKTFTPVPPVKPVPARNHRNYFIAGAVAGVIIIAVLISSGGGDEPVIKEETIADVLTQQQLQQGQAEATTEAVAETTGEESIPEKTTEAGGQQPIPELLASAGEDVKALRLTSPKDNNAYEKYQQVLSLDMNNEAAKQGIQSISDKYVAMAIVAIEAGKLDYAAKYLKKAEVITPASEKIANARNSLQEATRAASATTEGSSVEEQETAGNQATEESEKGLLDDMKEWYEKQAEQNKEVKKEDTTSDRFVRSLGGK